MSTSNGATPYQPGGGTNPHHPYPQAPQPALYPYPPMARPAEPRQRGASMGYPDLPTRPAQPARVQPATAADKGPMPRAAKSAATRMPKAQALEKARALKKVILGVTLGSFVAFASLAATHLNTSSSAASASSSSSSSNSSSANSSSSSDDSNGSNSGSSSSGFGFGSNSSQAPVSGSSSS